MLKKIGIICLLFCLIFAGCTEERVDSDRDGITDSQDAFPNNAAASKDSDNDGYPDELHEGYNETSANLSIDAFPQDSTEWKDTDGDGVGDEKDDFPYNAQISKIVGGESKTYNLAVGGEINTDIDIGDKDKSIVIYWELQGDSFTKRGGEALTMRYKSTTAWSNAYDGRTDQITVNLGENDEGRWTIKFMHDGRTLSPPYTDPLEITYSISKLQ